MKKTKLLFVASLLLLANAMKGQAIFSEDFSGTTPLSTWSLFNVDGLTPAQQVNAINMAWVVLNVSNDPAAISTSWYTPAGQADDYMITPAITLTSNNYLFFDALALNANFRDGYEVRISTAGATVADVLANPALLTVPNENASWTSRRIDLSAYAGQTVHLAWRNNSNDQLALAVDNIEIKEVIANDAGISNLNIASSYLTGSTITVAGDIENTGTAPLTSVEVNWSVDGGTTVNTDMLTVNIPSFGTGSFSHSMTITAAAAGSFIDLDVWTSSPNGVTDSLPANDSASINILTTNGTTVSREVLLEEFTTAPCQFCPDGAVVVEQILATNPSVIAVGEHACFSTDAMTIPEASTYCADFGSGAPTACVDRVLFPGETNVAHGRGTWATNASARANVGSPANINLTGTYNSASRQVSVDINTDFVDYVAGDIRVTLFVVEDSVTGTGPGYDQVNAFNAQAGHPYAGAGNPIVGFVHRHVLRDVYPTTDAWGDNTVIPAAPSINTPYNKNYTFTLNSAWKEKDVSLVAFVSYFNADVSQRVVLNASEVKLNNLVTSVNEIQKDEQSLSIYPNPTAAVTNFAFNLSESRNVELSIMDITGKKVIAQNFGQLSSGNQLIKLDVSSLTNGIYFVNLQLDNEVVTKKISVNR